jgi:predicted esterase
MNSPTYGCLPTKTCAYNIDSINSAAESLKQLIEYEKGFVGNNPKNVFLGGFSQGDMLTYHM